MNCSLLKEQTRTGFLEKCHKYEKWRRIVVKQLRWSDKIRASYAAGNIPNAYTDKFSDMMSTTYQNFVLNSVRLMSRLFFSLTSTWQQECDDWNN